MLFGADLSLAPLFDHLPDVYLYVKDLDGRFVKANESMWRLCGMENEQAMLGKTDFDLHPQYLAEQYVAEDRFVVESKQPHPNQTWLVPSQGRVLKWFLSTKIPILTAEQEVIGVAGAMRDLEKAKSVLQPFDEMREIITFVLRNYDQPIRVVELARRVNLSVSQLDRRFKKLYKMTPQGYILRVRIHSACRELSETSHTIAQIASRCGFYDQSYFNKQFRRHLGTSPSEYRLRYRDPSQSLSEKLKLPSE